uniref:Uncharacterized protein n=1 Tax=Wuchereria bancrofti TaxID=6293 RepID=A0AAF5RUU7_WUCBA
MPPAGVEPATLGLLDPRSNRLSYGGLIFLNNNLLAAVFIRNCKIILIA